MSAADKKSQFLCIIISPKEYQDPSRLLQYLKKWECKYIISKHMDDKGCCSINAFCEYKKEVRRDYQKKKILALYPDIQKDEQSSIRVITHVIDKDQRYGYGYTLKHGDVLYTTFSDEEHSMFLSYYNDRYSNSSSNVSGVDSDDKEKPYKNVREKGVHIKTLNELGTLTVNFVKDYFSGKEIPSDDDIEFVVRQFISMKVQDRSLKLDLFLELKKEKLIEYVKLYVK